ncbi:hypothetical protein JOH51_005748 [Rhizobium leguminosarum]|nr:hypothetical protein [Rhizobium leguminosarum]
MMRRDFVRFAMQRLLSGVPYQTIGIGCAGRFYFQLV